jgi:hypothetical protein
MTIKTATPAPGSRLGGQAIRALLARAVDPRLGACYNQASLANEQRPGPARKDRTPTSTDRQPEPTVHGHDSTFAPFRGGAALALPRDPAAALRALSAMALEWHAGLSTVERQRLEDAHAEDSLSPRQ